VVPVSARFWQAANLCTPSRRDPWLSHQEVLGNEAIFAVSFHSLTPSPQKSIRGHWSHHNNRNWSYGCRRREYAIALSGYGRLSWMHMKIILFKTKTTLRDERDWVY